MNKNIFREYDIRGTYPTLINEEVAYTIGKSYGSYIQEKLKRNIRISFLETKNTEDIVILI